MSRGLKFDTAKPRTDLVPVSAVKALANVLTLGAAKYGDRNWEAGIEWSRCYGATLRHLLAWWDGEDRDQESGLSHLDHALAEVAFLREFEETHRELDNRPNRSRPTSLPLPFGPQTGPLGETGTGD